MASRKSHKFIQAAIKRPGALTRRARAANMGVAEYARAHQHDDDLAGRQARFFLNVLNKVGK